MTLLSEGISKVRAFAAPAGIGLDGTSPQLVGVALIKWHSLYADKLHQIYVNGKFAGATVDTNQRQMPVQVPLSEMTAARIEVFAVQSRYAQTDLSDESAKQQGRVKIEFPREQALPEKAKINYYFDNSQGEIDYQNRLNKNDISLWPFAAYKGGFGMSSFGQSDFGRDGSAAIGFGKGNFGLGWFGFDADMMKWQSGQLAKGSYKFGIKLCDKFGNETTQPSETEAITVIPPATPAEAIAVESFDKDNGELVLEIK